MKSMLVPPCLALVGLIAPHRAAAQDVAITNARVIVGSGEVIESGTIIVRGGKIVFVGAGAAPTQGLRTIDAKGMSAMPGFIDGHKHVANGENAAAQMRSLLERAIRRSSPAAGRPMATSRCATASTRASSSAREGDAGWSDRRRPDRVRRAEHRPPVFCACTGAVAEGQYRALP